MLIEHGIESVAKTMWVKRSPEELILGYDEPLFALADFLGEENIPQNGKFAFFPKENDTSELPLHTVVTDDNNPYNLSNISLFNGRDSLNIWGNYKTESWSSRFGAGGLGQRLKNIRSTATH